MTGMETNETGGQTPVQRTHPALGGLPRDFINSYSHEGSLNEELWEKLEANCISRAEGPEEDQTTFIFSQWAPNDHHDLVIIADRANSTWEIIPKPHCHCSRGIMECECTEAACRQCGERFACLTPACDSEFCTDSSCRLCSHEREECSYAELLEDVRNEAQAEMNRGCSIASAHVGAVASVLAPGVGDAPIFRATVRILDELLGGGNDWAEAQRTWGRSLVWRCRDGSIIRNDPHWPGWLEYEEVP